MSQSETPEVGVEALSPQEIQQLVRAVLADGRVVEEQELERVVGWAHQVRVDATLLGLVLSKQLGVAFADGAAEPKFWIRGERSESSLRSGAA
jgi:hypothetical protein